MAANEPGQPLADGDALNPTRELAPPSSALAIGAHPDDVEFGGGGTLAKWADAGCVVHHLICTDGSKGTWDVEADTEALVSRRQHEQRAAARALAGDRAGEVVFLGHVDGELESSLAVRGEVARVIRRLRPDVVLGHDPWKQYRLHPDHRHAGLLACEAIVAARDPHFYREHRIPHHRPRLLLLWEAERPNHIEDVTATVDRKLAALEAHVSQFESTMKASDASELDAFRERIRTRLAELGRPHGIAAAEVFRLVTDL
ncbi:MAG: PIG-L deacetylase family protein [Ilumatobacteraceae bacterium]